MGDPCDATIVRNNMDIVSYKKILFEKQEKLHQDAKTNEHATDIVTLDQSSVGRLSRMDAMQAQAMSLETKKRRELELIRIKSALLRIENDEFGYCLRCDELISEKRLSIEPAATLCIECANKSEQVT